MPGRTRRRLLATAGSAIAAAVAGCSDGSSEPEGMTLEALDVAGSPGGTVPVLPAGKVTLLDYFATWCAPCKPQMKELRQVRETFDASTLHILSITNESDAGAVRSFWTEYEGTWPVAMDPQLKTNDRFGFNRVPTLLVLRPDGSEVWRHVGLAAADSVTEQVEAARR